MNIAVINIKDLAKYFLILVLILIILIAGIIIIEPINIIKQTKKSSFIQCLEMSLPIMVNEQTEKQKTKEKSSAKILDTQLAMMNNVDKTEEKQNVQEEQTNQNIEEPPKQEEIKEPENKKIAETENIQTQVIEENNIKATYNYDEVGVQVKNQSKYDVKDLIQNANYQIKNKQKVVIYHTHTCESYTSSEKYNYQMTGAYRTTDLNYTVAKVRRRTRRMPKTIWENSSTRQNIS